MLRVSIGACVIVAAAVFGFYAIASLETNPHITTNSPYYVPYSTVHMTGTGMNPGVRYDIVTIRPDGSVVTGAAPHNPVPPAPYDSAVANGAGMFTYDYTLTNVQADFLDGLAKGQPVSPTFRDALETQKVCDAVLASAKSGAWTNVG